MPVCCKRTLRLAGAMLIVALTGCGEESNIIPVTGVLTYKGKPVTNAFIDFVPEHGRQSWGQTDESGHFKLNYDPQHDGAVLGKHRVSVRLKPATRAEQEAVMQGNRVPMTKEMAEFFEKYAAHNSKKEVVVARDTREVRLDWD